MYSLLFCFYSLQGLLQVFIFSLNTFLCLFLSQFLTSSSSTFTNTFWILLSETEFFRISFSFYYGSLYSIFFIYYLAQSTEFLSLSSVSHIFFSAWMHYSTFSSSSMDSITSASFQSCFICSFSSLIYSSSNSENEISNCYLLFLFVSSFSFTGVSLSLVALIFTCSLILSGLALLGVADYLGTGLGLNISEQNCLIY